MIVGWRTVCALKEKLNSDLSMKMQLGIGHQWHSNHFKLVSLEFHHCEEHIFQVELALLGWFIILGFLR